MPIIALRESPPNYAKDDTATVAELMLQERPELPSALVHTSPENLPLSQRRALYKHDTSFSRQIRELTEDEARMPTAYLFTARSAVPVQHAVTAYYDALEMPRPVVLPIYVNKRVSRSNLLPTTPGLDRPGSWLEHVMQSEVARDEVARLSPLLRGIGSVCVVEQFIGMGMTANVAMAIAGEATDAANVSCMRGMWYQDIGPEGDLSEAEQRSLFSAIGEAAASQN